MADAMPVYIADTHSLVWYFHAPKRLPPAAARAFTAIASGQARLIVPVIVLADLIWIAQKGRIDVDIDDVIRRLQASVQVEIRPLECSRVLDLRRYTAVTEMHDRLIVAEAAAQGASLITSDEEIIAASLVPCVR
jgi:PIN domain nuclease of toxin-antitoxin system